MKFTNKKLAKILFATVCLSFVACSSKKKAADATRTYVDPLQNEQTKNNAHDLAVPTALAEEKVLLPCDYIEQLAANNPRTNTSNYQYLGVMSSGIESGAFFLKGGLQIQNAPLIQYCMGDFKEPSDQEFNKMAEEKYKAGDLGWFKHTVLGKAVDATSITTMPLKMLKSSAINDEFQKNLPGVFGEIGDLSNSMPILWVHKIQAASLLNTMAGAKILTAKLTLMGHDSWQEFATDMKHSMASATKGLELNLKDTVNNMEVQRQRMCSLVLLNRMTSQLLSIKGFVAPKTYEDIKKSTGAFVDEFNARKNGFNLVRKNGKFATSGNTPQILSTEDIVKYNPKVKLLKLLPLSTAVSPQGELADTLSLAMASISVWSATAPWHTTVYNNQFLGDIKSPSNLSVVPANIHDLSLGLFQIAMMNIKSHMLPVDRLGLPTAKLADALSILLIDNNNQVKLTQAAQLTELVVKLKEELEQLKKQDLKNLSQKVSLYSDVTLQSLIGEDSKKENLQKSDDLYSNILKLQVPLAQALVRAVHSKICDWSVDLKQGKWSENRVCSNKELFQIHKALLSLGKVTESKLLINQALNLN